MSHVHRIFGFIFLLLLLAASGGAHWLIVTWGMRAFPPLARYRRPAKYVVAAVVVGGPLLRVLARRMHSTFVSEALSLLTIEAMFVVMTLPLLVAAIAVARLASRPTERSPDHDRDRDRDRDRARARARARTPQARTPRGPRARRRAPRAGRDRVAPRLGDRARAPRLPDRRARREDPRPAARARRLHDRADQRFA